MSDHPLKEMLQRMDSLSNQQEHVSFGDALDAAGDNTFASILLMIGIFMLVPGPADIPGVPVVLGILVIIICVQMLVGRKHLWVPHSLEKRQMTSQRLQRMIHWLHKPANWMDRITKQRFRWLTNRLGVKIIGIVCILIAATTPILEFVPFSANVAGASIAMCALALIAKDGLVAAGAFVFCGATVTLVTYTLLG